MHWYGKKVLTDYYAHERQGVEIKWGRAVFELLTFFDFSCRAGRANRADRARIRIS
jgi:hypothetical protein